MIYEYWVTFQRQTINDTDEQMRFINETSEEMPEWELQSSDNNGRFVFRKPRVVADEANWQTKLVCPNFQCSIYVFGIGSSDILECPDCGYQGHVMSDEQTRAFMKLYKEVS